MTDVLTWEQALDALEEHIRGTEALLDGDARAVAPAGEWIKPSGLGPLPAHLVDRAMALRVRQTSLGTRLSTALVETRKQRQMAVRMETAPVRADAIYLDVTA